MGLNSKEEIIWHTSLYQTQGEGENDKGASERTERVEWVLMKNFSCLAPFTYEVKKKDPSKCK